MRSGRPGTVDEAAKTIARDCLACRARRINRVVTRMYDDALRDLGLTAAQLNLLVAVTLHREVSQAVLGRELDIEKSTLSRNVQRMVKNGWLRTREARGGPGQLIALTSAGRALLQKAYPAWHRAQTRAHEALGDHGIDALDSMAAALQPDRRGDRW